MAKNPCPICSASRLYLEARCIHCGWIPDEQRSLYDMPPQEARDKSRRLSGIWTAFAIAPSVAPLLLSLIIFSWLFAPGESQRNNTPSGFIIIPIYVLAFGLPVSYFVAGAFCLPVFFSLERRGKLNSFVISSVAVAAWWLFAAGSCFLLFILGQMNASYLFRNSLLLAIGLSPFVWASALTFAWIVRSSEHGVSMRSLMILLTILAFVFAVMAPAFRVFYFDNS